MPIGPGKYDTVCGIAANLTGAQSGVVLIVVDGMFGSGFSVKATPEFQRRLPAMLRELADGIEKDVQAMTIHDEAGAKQ